MYLFCDDDLEEYLATCREEVVWLAFKRKGRKGWWFKTRTQGVQHLHYGGETRVVALLAESTHKPRPATDLQGFVRDHYLPSQATHLTPDTYRREGGMLNNHLGPWFAGDMNHITRERILAYVNDRLGKASRGSLRNELRVLRHIMRMGTRLGRLSADPFTTLERGELPGRPEPRIRHVSQEEWRLILNALPVSCRLPVVLLVYTGLRRGELFKLTWEDVDLERGTALITHTKTRHPRIAYFQSAMVK